MAKAKTKTRHHKPRHFRLKAAASIVVGAVLVLSVVQVVVLRYELNNLKAYVDEMMIGQLKTRFSGDYERLIPTGIGGPMVLPELELQAPAQKDMLQSVRYRPTVVTDTLQAALVTDSERVFTYSFGACLNLYTLEVESDESSSNGNRDPVYLKRLSNGRTMKIFDNPGACAKEYSKQSSSQLLEFLKQLESY